MSVQELIRSIIERLQSSAAIKTVYGDPVESKGKTIIPVAKVVYGFGGGSGVCKKMESENGKCEGGGGGIMVKPKGVLEITQEETRFISFDETRNMIITLLAGLLIGALIAKKASKKNSSET